MNDQSTPLGDRLARIARGVLLAAIAVVSALIVLGPQNHGLPNPLSVGRANADGSLSAAPGYIIMPVKQGAAARFLICDSTKQVICLYEMNAEKLRLISVRKFDKDSEIFDASLRVGREAPEGHAKGLTRAQAGEYADAIKAFRENFEKKKKP